MRSRINTVLRHFYKQSTWNYRLCSTVPQTTDDRDPAPLFFDQHVQELLFTLTRINYEKIFSAHKDGKPLKNPIFKFMTDKELEEARSEIIVKAKNRIQMPPVVKMRSDKCKILSKDPALQGNETSNFIFTDISFGNNNRTRLIVVRDTNGTLRHANNNERHRMNQIYFPIEGREIHTPEMFNNPYLSDLLDRKEFEFILDRACLQFELDDPNYHRVTKEVYSYINKFKNFDALRSTRHFGPLAFYLVWNNDIHTLLMDIITSGNIEEAAALIHLYHLVYPETKSAKEPLESDIELIKTYARLDSSNRYELTCAIKEYEKLQKEKEEIDMGIKKAHGLINNENGNQKPKT